MCDLQAFTIIYLFLVGRGNGTAYDDGGVTTGVGGGGERACGGGAWVCGLHSYRSLSLSGEVAGLSMITAESRRGVVSRPDLISS
jgi:hypothetical protein